jgi:tripartite-type tricarboxylate transporter receptor subunit TctC
MKITRAIGTIAAAALLAGQALAAQTVLSGPIRLLVPYAPGGGTDTLTRIIAPYISKEFGQQVVVDNRPGGGGIIATQILARAAPDGQTLSMIDTSFAVNPSLYGKLPYVPAKTLKELVDLAKSSPGKLTYGSAGNGSGVHLAGEQLRVATGTHIVHVPYKGAAPQVADLLGGQVTMGLMVQSLAKPHLATGRLRALAITSERRTKALPE